MQELETLLNSLIQRGRKPWGKLVNGVFYIHSKSLLIYLNVINEPKRQIRQDSFRELVSLESGLWQFVCNNWLYKNNLDKYREWFIDDESKNKVIGYDHSYYQYRLLESALIPEEELAKFLVDNIVVEWNSK